MPDLPVVTDPEVEGVCRGPFGGMLFYDRETGRSYDENRPEITLFLNRGNTAACFWSDLLAWAWNNGYPSEFFMTMVEYAEGKRPIGSLADSPPSQSEDA